MSTQVAGELRPILDELEENEARHAELLVQIAELSGNGAVVARPKTGKRGRPAKAEKSTKGTGKRGRPKGSTNKPKAEKSTKGTGKRGRPKGSTNKPKAEKSERAPREGSLWSRVQKVLKTHKTGMTLEKLAAAIIQTGYVSKSADFGQVLYQTLQKKVNEPGNPVVKEEDKYRLNEVAA